MLLHHRAATKAGEGGVGCEGFSVLAGAAYESVMATAAELSRPTIGDRSLERSCSPNLSQEVVCEVFRSLHTLAGQVSGGLWEKGSGNRLAPPPFFPRAEAGGSGGLRGVGPGASSRGRGRSSGPAVCGLSEDGRAG